MFRNVLNRLASLRADAVSGRIFAHSLDSMFTIRKEQMAAFGPLGKKAFEDRVVDHLKRAFPQQSEALGDEKIRETIQYGTQRAAAYRIIAERDVCKYIDLMVLYGRDFDKDPNLPWAQSVLQNQAIKNPSTKVDRLFKAARKQPADERAVSGAQ